MSDDLHGTTCFELKPGQVVHVYRTPISEGDPCVCGEAKAPWGVILPPPCMALKAHCFCTEPKDHEGDHRCCCGKSWGAD